MRILMTIHHHLDPNSGAPGVTWQLGRCYEALGHQVDHLSFDDFPGVVPERLAALAFPSLVAVDMARRSTDGAVDVIDASSGDPWIWDALRIRRNSRVGPLLVTRSVGLEHVAHDQFLRDVKAGKARKSWKYPLYWGGYRLWEVARSLRQSDLAIFSNSADREYAIERLGVVPDRARVMPHGVPQSFLARASEPFHEVTQPIRIAQVGSYIPRKGVSYGVEALNKILRRHPSVTVSFLGTGAGRDVVLADFDADVRDQVTVHPRFDRDRLPELLAGHHIKLLPTLSEGFSLALIEAMACGLAPVTTSTPGAVDVVRDGSNGRLVPPRDSQAVESALQTLIENPALLQRLRRGAHETAQEYSWPGIAEQTLSLYQKAAEALV